MPAGTATRHRFRDDEQDHCAYERDHDFDENAGRGVCAASNRVEEQSANHRPGQPDQGVAEESHPPAVDDLGRQQSGDQPDDDPRDDVMTSYRSKCKNHRVASLVGATRHSYPASAVANRNVGPNAESFRSHWSSTRNAQLVANLAPCPFRVGPVMTVPLSRYRASLSCLTVREFPLQNDQDQVLG
jgi:hypothetical protein